MRPRLFLWMLGGLLLLVGLALLPSLALAFAQGEDDLVAFAWSAGLAASLGLAGLYFGRAGRTLEINHREGMAIVTLAWLVVCGVGALPFYLYGRGVGRPAVPPGACAAVAHAPAGDGPVHHLGHEFCDFTDSYFEAVSGFTTTGATVVTAGLWPAPHRHVGLPHGLLLWRALTQWLGGMGIILLSLAILPLLGVGGMQLYRAEVPGATKDKLSPRIAETAKRLWFVYVGLTLLLVLLTASGGVDLYVATTHALTTLATGGFSVLALSVEGFGSAYLEYLTTAFMLLAGTSFSLHYLALRDGPGCYRRDGELRVFLSLVLVAALVLGGALLAGGVVPGPETAFRQGLFQVASLATTTGFSSTDFEGWIQAVPLAGVLVCLLLFVGGCAGSTAGGMKTIRVIVAAKVGYRELLHLIHPRALFALRVGARLVDTETRRAVLGFLMLYVLVFLAGTLALAAVGVDALSAATASATAVGNVGPGLGGIGPYDNYHWLPAGAKWVLILEMLAGRLELYTVLVLFVPRFWTGR